MSLVSGQALRQNPAAFREALAIRAADGSLVPFAKVVEDWQRRDFALMDPSFQRAAGLPYTGEPRMRIWLERPRGHSKTSDLAILVTWATFAGFRLTGIAAAGDADQARILRDCIATMTGLVPWLNEALDVQQNRVLNRLTKSELRIISSDVATSFGQIADVIVADEIAHWPKRDLFDSLLSTAAKKPNCVFAAITNAGFQTSWQWELRERIRQDPAWTFSRLEAPCASWITAAALEEQRRLLPATAFARLWQNQWSPGAGDALPAEEIDAAVKIAGPAAGPEPGWQYVLGADLSLSRDATAVAVLGKHVGYMERVERERPRRSRVMEALCELGYLEDRAPADEERWVPGTGTVKLCDVRLWETRGVRRVDLEEVQAAIVDLHRRYNLSAAAIDIYQAGLMVQQLQRLGVPAVGVTFTAGLLQEMAAELLAAFHERRVELFPSDPLMADLKSLRVVERRDGHGFRLESPRRGEGEAGTRHGDLGSAFNLGLWAAKHTRPTSAGYRGSLVLSPLVSDL